MRKVHLLFIDNLRVLLITLVILQHLSTTYGAPAFLWCYLESVADPLEAFVYSIFNITNQAFFMGFFFMISAYFIPNSYDKKGFRLFLKDKTIRLCVPLLFFMLIITPVTLYIIFIVTGKIPSFFYTQNIVLSKNFFTFFYLHFSNYQLFMGPLWFIGTLFMFTVIYSLCRLFIKYRITFNFQPTNMQIALFALFLSLLTFITRVWFPVVWVFQPLCIAPCYFPQYIFLFIVRLIAYRQNWILNISKEVGRLWLWITVFLYLCSPFIIKEIFVPGGFTWRTAIFALWEQFFGIAMIITLLYWFRGKFNKQGRILKAMSASVYSVYIIHTPVIVIIALFLRNIQLNPFIKFLLVAPVAISICYLLGNMIRKLPLISKVL